MVLLSFMSLRQLSKCVLQMDRKDVLPVEIASLLFNGCADGGRWAARALAAAAATSCGSANADSSPENLFMLKQG